MNRKGFAPIILILIVVAAVALGGGAFYYRAKIFSPAGPKACTEEAKQCPDGSFVGRTGPNCEFAACPSGAASTTQTVDTSNWKTYRNEEYRFEFRYPSSYTISEPNKKVDYEPILLLPYSDLNVTKVAELETTWNVMPPEPMRTKYEAYNWYPNVTLKFFADSNRTIIGKCYDHLDTVGGSTSTVSINSNTFAYRFFSGSEGHGSRSANGDYRIIRGNVCYLINWKINYLEVAPFLFIPSDADFKNAMDSETKFNRNFIDKQQNIINQILSTLKFTK